MTKIYLAGKNLHVDYESEALPRLTHGNRRYRRLVSFYYLDTLQEIVGMVLDHDKTVTEGSVRRQGAPYTRLPTVQAVSNGNEEEDGLNAKETQGEEES